MKEDLTLIRHKLPANSIVNIYAVADVHLGAIEHDEAGWMAFRDRVVNEPNAYLILHGDLINNNTRSSVGSPYADAMRPRAQKKEMMEQLAPLRDKILCILPGNHEKRSLKDADDDPTYDIACKLDIEDRYRENIAFVYIAIGESVRDDRSTKATQSYVLCVAHGSGGGALSGGVIIKNERFARSLCGVDALIVGHSHNGIISRPGQLVVDPRTDRVQQRNILCVSTTSWQVFGGYAAQKLLQPRANASATEPQILQLSGSGKRHYVKAIW